MIIAVKYTSQVVHSKRITNPKWQMAAILKINKLQYLRDCLTYCNEIFYNHAKVEVWNFFKIQVGRLPPF